MKNKFTFTGNAISDIISSDYSGILILNNSILKKIGKARMKFNSSNEIELYATMNTACLNNLKNTNNNDDNCIIHAYEYKEIAKSKGNEYIVTLSYSTKYMYDTLKSSIQNDIDSIIKSSKLKQNEVTDATILRILLSKNNISGIRIHKHSGDKCYRKTKYMFSESEMLYILKKSNQIKIIKVEKNK